MESLKYKSCAFLDYTSYYNQLSDLVEEYDESLEYYDTATWINLTVNDQKVDKLSYKAYKALIKTEEVFNDLVNSSEKECTEALKIVLKSDGKLQK